MFEGTLGSAKNTVAGGGSRAGAQIRMVFFFVKGLIVDFPRRVSNGPALKVHTTTYSVFFSMPLHVALQVNPQP